MEPSTPREKPFFISPNCEECETPLVLRDFLDGKLPEEDTIWYDEWACPNTDCPDSQGIYMDWPPEDYAELDRRLEAASVPMSEMTDELPDDFPSEEELRELLGISDDMEIKIAPAAVQDLGKKKSRGDC